MIDETKEKLGQSASDAVDALVSGFAALGRAVTDAAAAFARFTIIAWYYQGGRLAALRGESRDWSQCDDWHRGYLVGKLEHRKQHLLQGDRNGPL